MTKFSLCALLSIEFDYSFPHGFRVMKDFLKKCNLLILMNSGHNLDPQIGLIPFWTKIWHPRIKFPFFSIDILRFRVFLLGLSQWSKNPPLGETPQFKFISIEESTWWLISSFFIHLCTAIISIPYTANWITMPFHSWEIEMYAIMK